MTDDFQFFLEPQESPDMDVDFVDQVHLIAIEQKPDDPSGTRKWRRLQSGLGLGIQSFGLDGKEIHRFSQA